MSASIASCTSPTARDVLPGPPLSDPPSLRTSPLGGDRTYLGQLFESLSTLTVRVFAQRRDATVFHVRTRDAVHEVDLLLERDDGRALAIEIKLSATVTDHDMQHLHWLSDKIGDRLIGKV